jgi:hypothetical protein
MIKRGEREAKVKVQLFEVQNLQLANKLLPTVI